MTILLYRQAKFEKDDLKTRALRTIQTGLRIMLLLLWPLLATALASAIWYFGFYRNGWHIEAGVLDIAIAAWLPIFGVLYTLLAAVAINTVFNQYLEMRYCVKNYDIDRFMILRNEDLSPIFHAAMTALACAVLFGFMELNYKTVGSGLLFVGSTTYLFSLMFQVICEIDNPCTGIWFIRSIPEDWQRINPRLWLEDQKTCTEVKARVSNFLDGIKEQETKS